MKKLRRRGQCLLATLLTHGAEQMRRLEKEEEEEEEEEEDHGAVTLNDPVCQFPMNDDPPLSQRDQLLFRLC